MAAGKTQWERPQGGVKQPFVPSASFTGARDGYHFTMGAQGLGYYKEAATAAATPAAASAPGEPYIPARFCREDSTLPCRFSSNVNAACCYQVLLQSRAAMPAGMLLYCRTGSAW